MSERLYSLLLRLYPAAFRERYAEEMERVFRDRLRHEGATRVWVDVLADALVSIPRQHIVREPHPMYPPSAAPLRALYAVVMRAVFLSAFVGACVAALGVRLFVTRVLDGWLMVGLMLLAVILVPWFRASRRAHRAGQSVKTFRAEARRDSVTIAVEGMAPLTLQRSEVIGLHDFEKVGLRIQTADPARDLWVPARVDSYAGVKSELSHWAPVKVTPSRILLDGTSGALLAFVYALAVVFPMPLALGLVGGLTPLAVVTLTKRDLPAHRRLLSLGPVAILLVRWLL